MIPAQLVWWTIGIWICNSNTTTCTATTAAACLFAALSSQVRYVAHRESEDNESTRQGGEICNCNMTSSTGQLQRNRAFNWISKGLWSTPWMDHDILWDWLTCSTYYDEQIISPGFEQLLAIAGYRHITTCSSLLVVCSSLFSFLSCLVMQLATQLRLFYLMKWVGSLAS